MNWITASILAILFLTGGNIFARFFSTKIPAPLATLYFVLGAIPSVIVWSLLYKITSPQLGILPKNSIVAALLGGAIWAFGQGLVFLTFSKNAPLSVALPLIVGGLGVGGAIGGILLFKESLTVMKLIGIITVLIGSIILAKS